MKRLLFIGIVLSVVAIGMSLSWGAGFFKVGQPAPTFNLTSISGESISLAELKGKVVVLGLFHICEPCMIQSTKLQKVYEATKGQNVAVVGVNSSGDSKADVLEFLGMFPVKITYPYLIDPGKITDKLYGGGRFIPNVYILDQQGVIRWQRVGNMNLADDKSILAEVDRLLRESSGTANPERL